MITQHEIECGEVRTTAAEKNQREREVKAYNDRAYALRKLNERQMDIQGAYIGVNLLLVAGIVWIGRRLPVAFYLSTLGYLLLAVNFIAALFLVFKMNNLKLAALVSIITVFAHWIFAIVVAANVAIMFIHDNLVKKLRNEPGYPEFQNLRLIVTDAARNEEMRRPVYTPKPEKPQAVTLEKPKDNGGMMEI